VQKGTDSKTEKGFGISAEDTFWAMGAVMDIDKDVEINLVLDTCRATLRAIIEREGKDV